MVKARCLCQLFCMTLTLSKKWTTTLQDHQESKLPLIGQDCSPYQELWRAALQGTLLEQQLPQVQEEAMSLPTITLPALIHLFIRK